MDDGQSVNWPRLLLCWAVVVAVALPLGWMIGEYVSGPVGWLLWGALLLGLQGLVLRLLGLDVNWIVVALANAGPVVGFEILLQQGAGDLFTTAALVALAPAVVVLLGLLVVAVFFMPMGIINLVSLMIGPREERGPKLKAVRARLREMLARLERWYYVYLVGALIGIAAGILVTKTVGLILLANDAYLGHILVRGLFGPIIALYAWGITRLWIRRPRWNERGDVAGEEANVKSQG